MSCIFCSIIKGEIPCNKVFENEEMLIFCDIAPQAEKHYLAVPKVHFANIVEMSDNEAAIVGRMLKKIGELANELGLQDGFRLVSNKGENACQSVEHLHIHILGGEKLSEKMG